MAKFVAMNGGEKIGSQTELNSFFFSNGAISRKHRFSPTSLAEIRS